MPKTSKFTLFTIPYIITTIAMTGTLLLLQFTHLFLANATLLTLLPMLQPIIATIAIAIHAPQWLAIVIFCIISSIMITALLFATLHIFKRTRTLYRASKNPPLDLNPQQDLTANDEATPTPLEEYTDPLLVQWKAEAAAILASLTSETNPDTLVSIFTKIHATLVKLKQRTSDLQVSADLRDAEGDVPVALSPSVSALVCPAAQDGLGRPASAAEDLMVLEKLANNLAVETNRLVTLDNPEPQADTNFNFAIKVPYKAFYRMVTHCYVKYDMKLLDTSSVSYLGYIQLILQILEKTPPHQHIYPGMQSALLSIEEPPPLQATTSFVLLGTPRPPSTDDGELPVLVNTDLASPKLSHCKIT